MPALPGIVKAVFDSDDSPIRFERFCLDIYREAEGVELLPTSLTRDLGRNGRTISILSRESRPVLCATLETDIDAKVKSDILRLGGTTQPRAVVYCCSKSLTEEKCAKIETSIRQLCPSIESVQVLGQIQLTDLSLRHEGTLRRHYGAEIRNVEEALLLEPATAPKARDIGLRIALLTHASDDATALKKELTVRLFLDTLLSKGPLTPEQLNGSITAQLRLPRTLSTRYTEELLNQLAAEDSVYFEDDKVALTESGIKITTSVPEEASSRLLEGRIAIREAIEKLSGYQLTESQFEALWDAFQDAVTNLFYAHGLAIVKMIRSVLAEETWSPEKSKLELPLEDFATRISSTIVGPPQRDEIRQAIIDMFFERDSAAFQWLTQVCGIYVMMCSLGFETLSSQEIVRVLSCFYLVPDSDVILSLLCEGEDNHDGVERILTGWKAVGGKLFMVRPVLEEVAYHAWISEYDYEAFGKDLSVLEDKEARRLIENAFVRAFRKLAGSSSQRKYWNQYIKEYKGMSELDYGYIMVHLRDDYGFGLLSETGEEYGAFEKRINDFAIGRLCSYFGCERHQLDSKTVGKARRDSKVITTVHATRCLAHAQGEKRTYCVISSARLLKEMDNTFRDELGDPEMVLSIGAMGFLLTLVPQVHMSFGTLRAVLFDTVLATRLTAAQRYAFRVMTASQEWDVPWSRRGTLQRELSNTVLRMARSRGEPARQITERLLRTDDPEFSAEIISTTLDNMGIIPRSRDELHALRSMVKTLEKQLQEAKSAAKSPRVSKKGTPRQKRLRKK